MKHKINKEVNVKNKKAYFKYEIIDTNIAGIKLQGTEIKSIRYFSFSFSDSYCFFDGDELYLKNFHISEFTQGSYNNHEPLRDRKLLLTKKQLTKWKEKVKMGGVTIVPLRIFLNKKGLCKMEIGLAKGKKNYDKRNSLKEKDMKREQERNDKY